jgi:hypothetical protein
MNLKKNFSLVFQQVSPHLYIHSRLPVYRFRSKKSVEEMFAVMFVSILVLLLSLRMLVMCGLLEVVGKIRRRVLRAALGSSDNPVFVVRQDRQSVLRNREAIKRDITRAIERMIPSELFFPHLPHFLVRQLVACEQNVLE